MSEDGSERVIQVLVRIEARLEALEQATARGFEKVNERLEKVNERLDKVIENTGAHYRTLERRVTKLEQRSPRTVRAKKRR